MSATATIISPEDLLQMPDQGKGYELIDGELKELDVSKESSHIAGQIFSISNHVAEQDIRLGFSPKALLTAASRTIPYAFVDPIPQLSNWNG